MIGAIAGDIVGSRFEFDPIKTTEFDLINDESFFTDDTVMTTATAFSLLTDGDYAENYRIFGRLYPLAGYGPSFYEWLKGKVSGPYNSWGNGSAMRVSPIGFAFDTAEEVLAEAERSAAVTHDHPEGIKGAQATALGIFLARQGADAEAIREEITTRFGYDLARTTDGIRPDYKFDVSCQGTVPEAIISFLESKSWEDSVRLAVSLGGDADTLACIAGAMGQGKFGPLPEDIDTRIRAMLPEHLREVLEEFESEYMA